MSSPRRTILLQLLGTALRIALSRDVFSPGDDPVLVAPPTRHAEPQANRVILKEHGRVLAGRGWLTLGASPRLTCRRPQHGYANRCEPRR